MVFPERQRIAASPLGIGVMVVDDRGPDCNQPLLDPVMAFGH
jgi:hypothetical protein